MAFYKRGKIYKIEREIGEMQEHYIKRGHFILMCCPVNNDQFDEYITLSRLYINVREKGCIYDKNIMEIIDKKIMEIKKKLTTGI